MKLFERLVEYELEHIMKGKRSDKEYKSLDYNKYSVNPVFFQFLKDVKYSISKNNDDEDEVYVADFEVSNCKLNITYNDYGNMKFTEKYSITDIKSRDILQKQTLIIVKVFSEMLDKIITNIENFKYNPNMISDKLGKFTRTHFKDDNSYSVYLDSYNNDIVILSKEGSNITYRGNIVMGEIVYREIRDDNVEGLSRVSYNSKWLLKYIKFADEIFKKTEEEILFDIFIS